MNIDLSNYNELIKLSMYRALQTVNISPSLDSSNHWTVFDHQIFTLCLFVFPLTKMLISSVIIAKLENITFNSIFPGQNGENEYEHHDRVLQTIETFEVCPKTSTVCFKELVGINFLEDPEEFPTFLITVVECLLN